MLRRVLSTLVITLTTGFGLATIPAKAQPQSAAKIQPGEGRPYEIADSEVWDVPDPVSHRGYQVFVALPPSYGKEPQRRYPVLYVTDADYAFPILRQISRRLNIEGPKVEEFILVGLSYSVGDTPEYSRRRDYTPTPNGEKTRDPSGRPPVFGEAEGYRRFLSEELMPFVAVTYRTDTTRSIYAGHSYGGLFGLYVLLSEPKLFSHYIIGSPSLWFDQKVLFQRERSYAEANKELKANVLMAIASYETIDKASGDPRYNGKTDMIADLKEFEQALRSRNYPGLKLSSEIIPGEDHLTVFPAIVTRGLLWALPAKRD